MIKEATINDFRKIDKMARAFYAEATYPEIYGAEVDEDSLIQFVVSMITDENKVIFIDEDHGMISGVVIPWFFNNNKLFAQEMAWWVEPEKRNTMLGGRLFKTFEKWAVSKGADFMAMGTLNPTSNGKVARFYEKQGMINTETMYGKQLCQH